METRSHTEVSPELEARWHRLCCTLERVAPFQTPEWLRAYNASFEPQGFRVLEFLEDGQTVAIIPLMPITARRYFRQQNWMEFGGSRYADYATFVCNPTHADDVANSLATDLRAMHRDGLYLGNFRSHDPFLNSLTAAMKASGAHVRHRSASAVRVLTRETYLSQSESGTRWSSDKLLKKLEKKGKLQFQVHNQFSSVSELLPQFFEMHLARFGSRGLHSMFEDPRQQRFFVALAGAFSASGDVWLSVLRCEEKPIAMRFSLRGGDRLPAAVFVGNAFGKLMGSTQIEELGELETPILLTSTLNVPKVADALLDYMLALPFMKEVRSLNAVVGETNDGYLNDIRSRPVGRDEVFAALKNASSGPVEEGSVGAGTGTVAFGWKGGIGTSSRRLPKEAGGYTVGVLVQTNYGGILSINGAPVGRELGQYYLKEYLEPKRSSAIPIRNTADGSIMMIVATDAPVDARNLKRMAARTMLGLGRTGSAGSNGSGDYAIAFSTASGAPLLSNDAMSPLFLAVIEATEEAIYNSLFRATTVTGNGHTVEALPIEKTMEVLRRHNAFKPAPAQP